ncbi:MAG: hypothetical protein HFE62_02605 [Firmicutes bacterium]|nr:hypothetical protein [Bacillota bacterium]
MKMIVSILNIVFIVLTVVGAIYVLLSHGSVNAGYAVVPMVFALAIMALGKNIK